MWEFGFEAGKRPVFLEKVKFVRQQHLRSRDPKSKCSESQYLRTRRTRLRRFDEAAMKETARALRVHALGWRRALAAASPLSP